MNITSFFAQGDTNASIYRGRITMKHDFGIMDADEAMYRYLGENSALPLPALAHPEDAEMVRDALEKVNDEPQRIIFRMLYGTHEYRYMYGVFEKSTRMLDGKYCIDAELMDIIRIHYKYNEKYSRVQKYRKFMSLSDKKYFEYNYVQEKLTIFEYDNGRAVQLYQKSLQDIEADLEVPNKYTFKQKAELETLLESLANYSENLTADIDGAIFGIDGGYMHLIGGIVLANNCERMFVGLLTFLDEQKKTEKYYMSSGARDSATGLYNKRAIAEIAMELIEKANENPVYLCVIDVDDFKDINDTYGHMAGDDIIAKAAEVLSLTVAERGHVGRFGGDEFLLVADGIESEEELINMFKTIRKNVAWQCDALYKGASITMSIGIAEYPKDAGDYEALFQVADKCVYLAKAKGKNRFIKYIEELHKDFAMKGQAGSNPKAKSLNIYATQCRGVVDLLTNADANDKMEHVKAEIQGILTTYDVDRFSLYGGDNYELKCCIGDTDGVAQSADFLMTEEFLKLFDINGLYAQNRILTLKESHPDIYGRLQKQGTEGYLLLLVEMPDGYKMLVEYDVVRRQRKWSLNEKGLLYIAAQIIAKRYYLIHKDELQ